jgi:hypothetical protein
MANEFWLVKLEFERVQTYLFAVPELKAMIGANTLLGEVLRGRLGANGFGAGADSLPALAQECEAKLPQVSGALELPAADPADPLSGADEDNPGESFRRGILTRDGGHLHAVFPTATGARVFIRRASDLVGEQLPGLLLTSRLVKLEKTAQAWSEARDVAEEGLDLPPGETLADLPQFQVCQATGQGPASCEEARPGEAPRWIAESVRARREAARRFDEGKSHDMLGLLRGALVRELGLEVHPTPNLFPSLFEDVAPSGYLAVVAADGNGIGIRSKERRERTPEIDFFAREAHGERFFHSMRVAVRKALVAALGETFRPAADAVRAGHREQLPFRLMMLGGDDLLLVCDAVHALPFVISYVRRLAEHPLADGKPLEVGVGVAIVKKKFPLHRSHALAEQLAGSAKRLSREQKQTGSTVDWLSVSEAWHEDVGAVRRRDFVRSYALDPKGNQTESLILSRKPYPVLGEGWTLERLWNGARAAVNHLPRSKLMALADGLSCGRRQADWALRQLDRQTREALRPALSEESAWEDLKGGRYATALLDFLEVFELERGREHRD